MTGYLRQLDHLYSELRRRHVFRVAAVYGAAVFGLLQVLSVVFPALFVPGWVMTVTVVIILAGFPVALSLGWVFDLTPGGVKRTAPMQERGPAQERSALAPAGEGDTLVHGQSVVAARIQRLDALLAREGVLPLARAVDIVAQLAAGLEADHARGLYYGRIRPEAVIIAPDRRGVDVVRLLDVDLAPPRPRSPESQPLSGQAAPEPNADDAAARRADVYALGLLLFRMLTGGEPHRPATLDGSVVDRPAPRRLSDVLPSRRYPGGIQRLLDRALAPRPEDRQADAGEFRRELAAAIEGEHGYTRVFARLRRGAEAARADSPASAADSAGPLPSASSPRLSRAGIAVLFAVTVGIAAVAFRVTSLLLLSPSAGSTSAAPAPPVAPAAPVTQGGLAGETTTPVGVSPSAATLDGAARLRKHAGLTRDPSSPVPATPLSLQPDPDDATLILVRLSERSGVRTPEAGVWPALRDTAAAIWRDTRLPAHTRAFAAFLAGSAEAAMHLPASCASWVERAVALDPQPGYRDMLASCRTKS